MSPHTAKLIVARRKVKWALLGAKRGKSYERLSDFMNEIVEILTKLQKGYDEKIPENANVLLSEIFSSRQDLLTLGTGTAEVCIGRDEVTELIRGDWDGGWGDFTIDIGGAKIDADSEVAWFYAKCTVKYSFEDADDKGYNRYIDWVKEIAENQTVTPKQRISFINWALGIHYHQRKPGKREYLWPSEISGMLVKENDMWKIATLHFAVAKSNYPDERFEDLVGDYQEAHNYTKNKIIVHNRGKADGELVRLMGMLENELADDAELAGLCFDTEQILEFDMGRFAWIIAMGTVKQDISENQIFDRSLRKIEGLLNSDLTSDDKLFQTKRSIAYALKETASGAEFSWPIRLTAVIEKAENGYKFRQKHFSYPFYWIFEGKL